MTPAGIEPATFRFVADNINHCATAVPIHKVKGKFNPVQAMKAYGNNGGIDPLILNFDTTRLNAWFHGSAALSPPPAKKTLLLIEYEAGWAPEPGTRPQLRGSVQLHDRTKYRVEQIHSHGQSTNSLFYGITKFIAVCRRD